MKCSNLNYFGRYTRNRKSCTPLEEWNKYAITNVTRSSSEKWESVPQNVILSLHSYYFAWNSFRLEFLKCDTPVRGCDRLYCGNRLFVWLISFLRKLLLWICIVSLKHRYDDSVIPYHFTTKFIFVWGKTNNLKLYASLSDMNKTHLSVHILAQKKSPAILETSISSA